MENRIKIYRPQGKLAQVVEFFYEIDITVTAPPILPQKILPCGHTMIIFTVDGYWQIAKDNKFRQLPACCIIGQVDKYFYLKPSCSLHSFGIAFKPHAFRLLFGWDLDEFNDKAYYMDEVFGKEGILLMEQVFSAKEGWQRIKFVEDFLLVHLQKRDMKYDNPIIPNALQIVSQNSGDISVQELSSNLHISERHLERLFRQHVGLCPKKWSNLIRFIHVMRFLSKENISPLTLTAWLNYFDHSHFYRDFYKFSGEHFSQWDPKAHPLLNDLLEKDFLGPH